jgi:hypothetical protein
VLQHNNQRHSTELPSSNQRRALFLLLLHFHVSTVHVNSGDIKVQKKKKKKKENEGLGKTGKESNSSTKQTLWEENEQNKGIEKCSTFIFLPLCFYHHYTVQVNFNSLEQCSNTHEFSTHVLLCPTRSLAWASDRAELAGFSPTHMGRTGSDPNLNTLNRVWSSKIKKIQ